MRSTRLALRLCLIAVAGVLAAVVAHVVIDIAGDFVLAHDAYDGIAHDSRPLLLAVVGVVFLVSAARAIFQMLDRRYGSRRSALGAVRDALGNRLGFAIFAAVAAVAALVAMESMDAALAGQVDDVADLFGGSIALGAGSAVAIGIAIGSVLHFCLALLAKYEAPIATFIAAAFALASAPAAPSAAHSRSQATPAARAVALSRHHRKRGPPDLVFG